MFTFDVGVFVVVALGVFVFCGGLLWLLAGVFRAFDDCLL